MNAQNSSTAPVRSVSRALALLVSLSSTGTSLSEAAEAADIPLPTALRIMRTLEDGGFVERRNDGSFVVGPTAVMLAYQSDPTGPLRWIIRELVVAAREATGETAAFFLRRGVQTVCVEVDPCTHPIRWVVRRGTRAPLHHTAAGRLLLALGPTGSLLDQLEEPGGSVRQADDTTRSRPDLEKELEIARESALATNDAVDPSGDGWELAIRFPTTGIVMGALSIQLPRSRAAGIEEDLVERLRTVTASASADLPLDPVP